MGREIERKFLVRDDRWRGLGPSHRIRQGYLSRAGERVVRVRIDGETAQITIKGAPHGAERAEFEYAIPLADAEYMLAKLCLPPAIEKTRHEITIDGVRWQVDEFHQPNRGLVLAEVELPAADFPLVLPDWIAAEVTGEPRYYNQNMGIDSP
jgi:adenylate cyclase